MTGIYSDKPNLSFWVSELHSDKANLFYKDLAGHATRVWLKVGLNDLIYSQKLKLKTKAM